MSNQLQEENEPNPERQQQDLDENNEEDEEEKEHEDEKSQFQHQQPPLSIANEPDDTEEIHGIEFIGLYHELISTLQAVNITTGDIIHGETKCVLCNDRIVPPKVTLHCQCEYHLQCYITALKTNGNIADDSSNRCLGCDDKIYKIMDDDYETCSICLELLKEEFQKLRCKHRFHNKCIKSWQFSVQHNNNKCPICRTCIY